MIIVEKNNLPEVTLKNLKGNRKYSIWGKDGEISQVSASNNTVVLKWCRRYTVKSAGCNDMYLTIPPGRYIWVLVVSFLFFLFLFFCHMVVQL